MIPVQDAPAGLYCTVYIAALSHLGMHSSFRESQKYRVILAGTHAELFLMVQ